MPETIITVRPNGPYRVRGPFKLVDEEGNEFELPTEKEFVALCRCGASASKPFCDGSHRAVDFRPETRAAPRS